MNEDQRREVTRLVGVGLAEMRDGDTAAADQTFRHAVHICADAAAVALEIVWQSGGQL